MERIDSVEALKKANIPFRLIPLSSKVKSHSNVSFATDKINIEDDCKTIIAKDDVGKYYALFLRGMHKIDFSKLHQSLRKKLSIVSSDELLQVTGKVPGTVCPLLLEDMQIIIDLDVKTRKQLFFSSGDKDYGIEIGISDFLNFMGGQLVDFHKE